MSELKKGEGLRYNEGKSRHDLVPAFAQEQYTRVLTKGATKYAERNWEKGMPWSKVISSLERHLQAIKRGEDHDKETGLLHAAHIMCNAGFLTEYYRIYPQGDDRPHWYISRPRIALDIDEVIADWVGHWTKYHGQVTPEFWNFDAAIGEKFEALKEDKPFWLSIPPRISPSELPFEPTCYVTSRVIPTAWTEEWIAKMGFPTMPVITVGPGQSKVQTLKEQRIDIFVDDRFENFAEINSAGILCYLMDAPHNRRYDVGFKRITSLSQVLNP
jgi:5'(3')-deoxyribonucleotidase